jgi:capsular polysaccharide biosynthesis protein
LVEVVSSAHSPLPEVILEDVVAVLELVRVALGLRRLVTLSSVNASPVVNINVIETLRRSEAEVIVAWGSGLSETSERSGNKAGSLL